MELLELTSDDYKNLVKEPFTIFDSVAFMKLNEHKVDKVNYASFNNGKNRFGLIFGERDSILVSPFSSPYSCFTSITKNNKIKSYTETCEALVKHAKKSGMKKIKITLPPLMYDEDHITKIYNSLYICGFKIAGCDINYHYCLDEFDDEYQSKILPQARQKLKNALSNNLRFEKTDNIELAYDVIKQNREAKGYPLWMTLDEVYQTINVVKTDFFLVYDENNAPVASAMVYHVTNDCVQVIYWGNTVGSDSLRPMNFLSFKTLEYYRSENKAIFDVGPSTEFSIPNNGLCDFKQSIGCKTSPKFTFEMEL